MIYLHDKNYNKLATITREYIRSNEVTYKVNEYPSIDCVLDISVMSPELLKSVKYISIYPETKTQIKKGSNDQYVEETYKTIGMNYIGPRLFTVDVCEIEDDAVHYKGYTYFRDMAKSSNSGTSVIEYGKSSTYSDIKREIMNIMPSLTINGVTYRCRIVTINPVMSTSTSIVDYSADDEHTKQYFQNKPISRIIKKQDFSIHDVLEKLVEDNPSLIWFLTQTDALTGTSKDFTTTNLTIIVPKLDFNPSRILFNDSDYEDLVVGDEEVNGPTLIMPRGATVDVGKGDIINTISNKQVVETRLATRDEIDEEEDDNELRLLVLNTDFSISKGDPFNSPNLSPYIEIPALVEKNRGLYEKIDKVTFDNISDPVKLAYAGYEYGLQKLISRKTYELKMREVGSYLIKGFHLGSNIMLVRESDETCVQSLITGLVYDFVNTGNSEMILGATYSKNELDRLNKIDKRINVLRKAVKRGINNNYTGYLDVQSNALVDLQSNMYWGEDENSSDTGGITTYNEENGVRNKTMAFTQKGIRIASTKDSNNKWVWKDVIDFNGINASAINKGVVNPANVSIGKLTIYEPGYDPSTKISKDELDLSNQELLKIVDNKIASISNSGAIQTDLNNYKSSNDARVKAVEDLNVSQNSDINSLINLSLKGENLLKDSKSIQFGQNTTGTGLAVRNSDDSWTITSDIDKVISVYAFLNSSRLINYPLISSRDYTFSLDVVTPVDDTLIMFTTNATSTSKSVTMKANIKQRIYLNFNRGTSTSDVALVMKLTTGNRLTYSNLKLEDGNVTSTTFSPSLEEEIIYIKNDTSSIKSLNTTQSTDISTLKTDVSSIKSLNTTQSTDISTLKTDVAGIKSLNTTQSTDISTLKTDVSNIKALNTTQSTDISTVTDSLNNYKSSNDARVKAVEDVNNSQNGEIYIIKSDISSIKNLNNSQQSVINSTSTDFYNYKSSNDARVKAVEDLNVTQNNNITTVTNNLNNYTTNNDLRVKAVEDVNVTQTNDIKKLKEDTSLILGVRLPLMNNDITNLGNRIYTTENNLIETNSRISTVENNVNNLKLSPNEINVLNNISPLNLLSTEAQNSVAFSKNTVSKNYSAFTVTVEKDREFIEIVRMRKPLTSSTDSNKNLALYYKVSSKEGTIIAPNETIYISLYVRGGLEINKLVPMIYGTDASTKTLKNYMNPSVVVTPGIQVITVSYKNTGTVNIENPYINLWFAEANIYNDKQINFYDYNIDIIRTFMNKSSTVDVTYIEKYIVNDSFNKLDNQRLRAELKALNIAVK